MTARPVRGSWQARTVRQVSALTARPARRSVRLAAVGALRVDGGSVGRWRADQLQQAPSESDDPYNPVVAVDYSLLEPGNGGLRERLIASEREYVELEFTAEAPPHPWESQLGGRPYLIDGDVYPRDSTGRPMTFLIQLNFADLPHLAGYPDEGLLQFFIGDDDTLGCRYGDGPDQFRVVYHPSIDTDWQPRSGLPPIDPYCSPLGFDDPQPRGVVGRLDRMPVPSTDNRFATLVGEYDIDTRDLNNDEKSHRLGGYPYIAHFDDMRAPIEDLLLLQLAEAYLDVGGWAEDLLIWGDGGVANFFIAEADLAARDFSRVEYDWASH